MSPFVLLKTSEILLGYRKKPVALNGFRCFYGNTFSILTALINTFINTFPLTSTYWMPTKYANIFCTKIRLCLRNICQHFNFFFHKSLPMKVCFCVHRDIFTPEANQWRTLREKYPFSEFFRSVFSRFQSKCRKKWTRKTPNTYTFHAVTVSILLILLICNWISIIPIYNENK